MHAFNRLKVELEKKKPVSSMEAYIIREQLTAIR